MTRNSKKYNVGVLGATGTTGCELVARLLLHPGVELRFATSREHTGQTLRAVDSSAPAFPLTEPREDLAEGVELLFSALPHRHSATWVEKAMTSAGEPRVIDLSGDFRLKDPELHDSVYGSPRSALLASAAVYGLTELNRSAIAEARLVANPGCYPTCSALALAPLVAGNALDGDIVINAMSGVSGAGRGLKSATQFIAVYDDARPYGLGRSHRHTAEIEQTLTVAGGNPHHVIFNPHVIPVERGMLATITARGARPERVHDILSAAYQNEPFVEVLPLGTPATIRATSRSNRAVLGVHEVKGTEQVVLTSSIDNLVKGAAGQAIQNMNLMLGFHETTGFEHELRTEVRR